MAKDPLIIDRPVQAGEKFNHDGSIIFKTFVADGVEATATDGGIMLEQGGGNNLKLDAKGGVAISVSGVTIRGGSVSISSVSGGSISIINGRVFINGKEVTQDFNSQNAKPQISGVTAKAALGDNVAIVTNASVAIADTGNALKVRCDGSLSAKNMGDNPILKTGGSASIGNVGKSAKVDTGGSLNAGTLGGGNYAIGGSADVGSIGAGSVLNTGGSINGGHASKGAKLDAGGSINLAGADEGVSTEAGGSVRIAGRKPGKKSSGFDFNFN